MTEPLFRAVALLVANPGEEQALIDFTIKALPSIRAVSGLRRVEFSRSLSNKAQFSLYYWWESAEASKDYMEGGVYADLGPKLASLVCEHTLIVTELLDG